MKVIVCDCCKKPYASWHYSNSLNSSKFCDICGSYCSEHDLLEEDIDYYEQRHQQWLKEQERRRNRA